MPSNDPVAIMSNRPSSINDFIDVRAAEHSCISSKIRTVLFGINIASGLFAEIFIIKSSTFKSISKHFFILGSFLKSIKTTFS